MGSILIVPEGLYDFDWLVLWQRLAQSAAYHNSSIELRPITIIPTDSAAIVETYKEICRFRSDAIPIVDGDEQGTDYLKKLSESEDKPQKIIKYGDGAAVECLSSWFLEPHLHSPGDTLKVLMQNVTNPSLKEIQRILCSSQNKKDRELHENLVWEALDCIETCERVQEFYHDLAAIAFGDDPINETWKHENVSGEVNVYTASHISKVK